MRNETKKWQQLLCDYELLTPANKRKPKKRQKKTIFPIKNENNETTSYSLYKNMQSQVKSFGHNVKMPWLQFSIQFWHVIGKNERIGAKQI